MLILASHFAQATPQTAADLLEHCTLAMRQSDGENLQGIEITKAVSCVYYLSGFLDASGAIHSLRPQTRLACLPANGISNDQAVRILVKHLKNSPETLHESGRMQLTIALVKAFPCQK